MALEFLLIDDDADDSDLIFEALNQIDSTVKYTYAMEGPEAFKMFDSGYKPNVIFLDINMPGMDGWHCLTKLKENEDMREIPVIMYSTSSYPHDFEKAFKLGALTFFTKPNHYLLLKKNIQIVLDALYAGELQTLQNKVLESMTPSEKKP